MSEELRSHPDIADWHDVEGYDPKAWPARETRHYQLVPTTCFNCEANCGLVAWIDKDTGTIAKLEGNPHHPGEPRAQLRQGPGDAQSGERPRTDPPSAAAQRTARLRAVGASRRGTKRSTRSAAASVAPSVEGRHDEVLYHVGRPGDDSYIERVLHAWGIDGHNSHTNICSSGARLGYAAWMGFDRPSADFANAKVIFLISSHLEAGHYFNPHAQRIMEGKQAGATVICVDPRLSNTGVAGRLVAARRGRVPRPRSCWRSRGCCSRPARGTASSCGDGSTGRRISRRCTRIDRARSTRSARR